MREITVRAWDNEEEKFYYFTIGQGNENFTRHGIYDRLCINGARFEQYTGLKDKNGKEIYEGDIVDCSSTWWNASGPAGHKSPNIVVQWLDYTTGFDPFGNYDSDCGVYIQSPMVEVIGNIHESPEHINA